MKHMYKDVNRHFHQNGRHVYTDSKCNNIVNGFTKRPELASVTINQFILVSRCALFFQKPFFSSSEVDREKRLMFLPQQNVFSYMWDRDI